MPDNRLPDASGFAEYETLLLEVSRLLERARQSAGRAVNVVMTAAYWQIGQRIVEQEQQGSTRASYGEELVAKLAKDLTARFGRGFSRTNVFQMRQFFLAYREKIQTLSEFSGADSIIQTAPGSSAIHPAFPLSWSHYVRLLTVPRSKLGVIMKANRCVADGLSANWTGRSPVARKNVCVGKGRRRFQRWTGPLQITRSAIHLCSNS